MQTPADPKWLPSHLVVNSARAAAARAAAGSETVRARSATRKEIVCKRQQTQKWLPSHFAVNSARVAVGKGTVSSW